MQSHPSLGYNVENLVWDLVSEKNYNIFDLVNMLFISIFLANFSGLLPYSQTITSQLIVTIIFSVILMFAI
jgi:F0F1-type ATP synthase membrane subunit a